jgi:hypothetical protein
MGITQYEVVPINNQPSWAFDTQFAYTYTGGRWQKNGAAVWHGDYHNFFWSANYEGIFPGYPAMFVSNFQVSIPTAKVTDDPIWTYNSQATPTWAPFSYSPDASLNPTNKQPLTVTRATNITGAVILNYIESALIIVPFKDRLIMLNTIENNANGATQFNTANPLATGVTPSNSVISFTAYAATTANLTAVYNNAAAGVGATLTNSGAMVAFAVDGVSPVLGAVILVKNQTTDFQNGLYTLTTVGSGAANWVLTRATNYNTPAQIIASQAVFVTAGATNTGTTWLETQTIVTIGVTTISYGVSNYLTSTNTQYVNRCRFSIFGSPFDPAAWLEANQVYLPALGGTLLKAEGGGYIDAATEEAIVSAEFIKDRLIVYFENSTWELAYTGNQELPFDWQKINTEFGAEGTYATVPFDKVILTVGTNGITACNGSNVDRIDQNIPDEVFTIRNKNMGIGSVCGIRDYDTEMVYWSFPTSNELDTAIFPNRVFVFNYKTGTWAFNDDSITAWGYFEQQTDLTWANATQTWAQYGEQTWGDGITQSMHRQVLAGNQQGFMFVIAPNISENAPVMSVTLMIQEPTTIQLTVMNHTLNVGEYVAIGNATIATTAIEIYPNVANIIPVYKVIDANTIEIGFDGYETTFAGVYTGGSTITRVSNPLINSKQWNPYLDLGINFHLSKITFGILKTADGEVTVDYYPSSTTLSILDHGEGNDSILGTGILETHPYDPIYAPLEQEQTRLWHPLNFQTYGNSVQISISMSEEQITTPAIAFSPFELHGMVLHTQKTSARIQ